MSPGADMASPERPKVMYIMGWGRSGSTVLDAALGGVPGIFSAGELHGIWPASFGYRLPCSCGRELPDCSLWAGVLADVLGPRESWRIQAAQLARIQHRCLRERNTLGLLMRASRPSRVNGDIRFYTDTMERLYLRIAAATRSSVVIDSSKVPTHAVCLSLMQGVDPYVVHLVRDPRATGYSWNRPRSQPGPDGPVSMPVIRPTMSAVRWMGRNLLSETVRAVVSVPSIAIRYEDFTANPAEVLTEVLSFIRQDASLPFVAGSSGVVRFAQKHVVGGNPVRFAQTEVTISHDASWMNGLAWKDRLTTTVLSAPLLWRYKYAYRP